VNSEAVVTQKLQPRHCEIQLTCAPHNRPMAQWGIFVT